MTRAATVRPMTRAAILRNIKDFKDELTKLKKATSILELALWKNTLNENGHKRKTNQCQKKMRSDESIIRQHCQVTCGADVVIGHVLPFLIVADK